MEMTVEEIVRHYRQAKDKRADIAILADLNCVTNEEIHDILVEAGAARRKCERKKPAAPVEKHTKASARVSDEKRAADIIELCESVLGCVSKESEKDVRERAYALCHALFLEWLGKRLRCNGQDRG